MKKPIVAVDIDEVLALHNAALAKHHNRIYGTNHTANDYDEDWKRVWNVDQAEVERRASIWHASEDYSELAPVSGALSALEQLKSAYELVVISGRAQKVEALSRRWLERHYTRIFSNIKFIELWGKDRTVTKAQVCKKLGVNVLVDDSLKQVLACAEVVDKVLLFGDYLWNQADQLPKNAMRVKNWGEVVRVLLP